MADNLSIESPDFDRIRKGDGPATEDAVRLLWYVLNNEIKTRRQNDRVIERRLSPAVLPLAPTGGLDNIDTQDCGLIVYTGASSVSVTGYRAGQDGDVLFILVTGAGTITHNNQDASSDAGNRMVFQAAANKAVGTNRAIVLQYYNSRWREISLA